MSNQHLHNTIGNVIGEARKRLKDRLKAGTDLDAAISLFLSELKLELDQVVKNLNPRTTLD
jgi:glutamine synthetase type III